jgi:hypothetical protein
MNARAGFVSAAALGIWLAFAAPAGAHRIDEYLQATRVSIDVDRIGLDIALTPGASVAPQVLEWIDTNRDGEISAAEGDAYARLMIGSVVLSVDGRPEPVTLVAAGFPDVRDMRLGEGTIRIRAIARLSATAGGRHRVSYVNSHRPEASVYLVNALVPEDPRIRIADQRRDEAQHGLTVDYSVRPWTRGWLFAGLVVIGALVMTRKPRTGQRQQKRVTYAADPV